MKQARCCLWCWHFAAHGNTCLLARANCYLPQFLIGICSWFVRRDRTCTTTFCERHSREKLRAKLLWPQTQMKGREDGIPLSLNPVQGEGVTPQMAGLQRFKPACRDCRGNVIGQLCGRQNGKRGQFDITLKWKRRREVEGTVDIQYRIKAE